MQNVRSGTFNWANNTTYVATYSVVDYDEAVANTDIRVTGALDAALNTHSLFDLFDVFSINTLGNVITGTPCRPYVSVSAASQATPTKICRGSPIVIQK